MASSRMRRWGARSAKATRRLAWVHRCPRPQDRLRRQPPGRHIDADLPSSYPTRPAPTPMCQPPDDEQAVLRRTLVEGAREPPEAFGLRARSSRRTSLPLPCRPARDPTNNSSSPFGLRSDRANSRPNLRRRSCAGLPASSPAELLVRPSMHELPGRPCRQQRDVRDRGRTRSWGPTGHVARPTQTCRPTNRRFRGARLRRPGSAGTLSQLVEACCAACMSLVAHRRSCHWGSLRSISPADVSAPRGSAPPPQSCSARPQV